MALHSRQSTTKLALLLGDFSKTSKLNSSRVFVAHFFHCTLANGIEGNIINNMDSARIELDEGMRGEFFSQVVKTPHRDPGQS